MILCWKNFFFFIFKSEMAPHKLTLFEKRSRLTFALNNLENDFQNVCFVDEASCWTLRPGLYHNKKKTSKPKCNGIQPNHTPKIHVWSGIWWDGHLPFVVKYWMYKTLNALGILIETHKTPLYGSIYKRDLNGI